MPAAPSPVRTRTITEIVPGTYGYVTVGHYVRPGWVDISWGPSGPTTASELRAAAKILLDIADALDAGACLISPEETFK